MAYSVAPIAQGRQGQQEQIEQHQRHQKHQIEKRAEPTFIQSQELQETAASLLRHWLVETARIRATNG